MSPGATDPTIDAATVRRLLRHEAEVHAVPGRSLRDPGDALLLHDEVEPEPFWNRVEAIRWPTDAAGFDRRLGEVSVVFASIGRQPHVWTSPPHDEPADLVARLSENGFEDVGDGLLLVARDVGRARVALADRQFEADMTLERLSGVSGMTANLAAEAIVSVLLIAFDVGDDRRPGCSARMVGHVPFVVRTVAVLLPATILMGYAFPLAGRLATPSAAAAGGSVGLLYAANTAGSILGSFGAAFVLAGTLGTNGSILLLGAINLLAGAALFLADPVGRRTPAGVAGTRRIRRDVLTGRRQTPARPPRAWFPPGRRTGGGRGWSGPRWPGWRCWGWWRRRSTCRPPGPAPRTSCAARACP